MALDFPNNGQQTRLLFKELDKVVLDNGGRLYPAKDACMNIEAFERCYPEIKKFPSAHRPCFFIKFLATSAS